MSEGDRVAEKKSSVVKLVIRGSVAILVSILALWWAFRDVPFAEISEKLSETDLGVFTAFVLITLAFQFLRAVRWAMLVLPVKPVSYRAVGSAALVGIPAAAFLPLRLGEFVRPIMIARAGVPFATGMASVVVERVADGLFNVGLFFLLLALMPASAPLPPELSTLGKGALIVFGGACAFLVLGVVARNRAYRIIHLILDPVSERIADRICGLLGTFLEGVSPLAKPTRFLSFVVLTTVYWGLNGLITTYLARSYGLDLPWVAGPFAVTCVVFAIMVPAGPAFAGTLEVGMRLGLAPFSVTPSDAAVVGISVHIATLLVLAVTTGIGFLIAEPGQTRGRGLDPPA